MKDSIDQRYYQLLEELQAIDFVLIELNLYLDTHPNDQQAIEQYNHHVLQRAQLAQQYEALYGPLRNFGQSLSPMPFRWNQGPWPWQV
jgi:spore coat protein JB